MFRNLSVLILLTLSTFLIGITSSLIIGLLVCIVILGLWATYQSFQQQRFLDWLKNSSYETCPNGYGIWKLIYSCVHPLLKRGELQENKLKNNLVAFKTATEAMEDGLLIIDNNNQIVAITPRAEHYLNISQEQDCGSNIINHVRNPSFVEYLLSGSLNKTIIIEDLSLDKKALEFKLLPFDATQKIILCRDVTKLRKLEVEKKDFVASASHELKTPLTVLTGYLETISEIEINKVEKNKSFKSENIEKQINRILKKIEKKELKLSELTLELEKQDFESMGNSEEYQFLIKNIKEAQDELSLLEKEWYELEEKSMDMENS